MGRTQNISISVCLVGASPLGLATASGHKKSWWCDCAQALLSDVKLKTWVRRLESSGEPPFDVPCCKGSRHGCEVPDSMKLPATVPILVWIVPTCCSLDCRKLSLL